MRVPCVIDEVELEGDHGPVDSISAQCQRCEHVTESFGTSEASVKRCLALMREECPEGERNFYVDSEDYTDD